MYMALSTLPMLDHFPYLHDYHTNFKKARIIISVVYTNFNGLAKEFSLSSGGFEAESSFEATRYLLCDN